jgi:hypothetical protein
VCRPAAAGDAATLLRGPSKQRVSLLARNCRFQKGRCDQGCDYRHRPPKADFLFGESGAHWLGDRPVTSLRSLHTATQACRGRQGRATKLGPRPVRRCSTADANITRPRGDRLGLQKFQPFAAFYVHCPPGCASGIRIRNCGTTPKSQNGSRTVHGPCGHHEHANGLTKHCRVEHTCTCTFGVLGSYHF